MKTYSQVLNDISRFPKPRWLSAAWFILHILKYGPKLSNSIKRAIKANLVENEGKMDLTEKVLIDVLVPCTTKDLKTLPLCLESVIVTVINPIRKIWIACPPSQFDEVKHFITSLEFDMDSDIQVVCETDYIEDELYTNVKKTLGAKAGHAIQQMLKVSFVAQSPMSGVLVLDSDTVLLQKSLWLDKFENQILQLSWENVPEHYLHLEELCKTEFDKSYNTVTHHMLMQPKWMREFIDSSSQDTLKNFLMKAFEFAQKDLQSIYSLDYLFYGLNAIKFKNSHLMFARWCNLAIVPTKLDWDFVKFSSLQQQYPYKSISFHQWQA
jgi:hypothetical protein